MSALTMQMVYCIPVEIDDQVAAVACCDVYKVLSAGAITPLPGVAEPYLGITSDGQGAWLVATIAKAFAPPRRSSKARVLCLAGIPGETMLAIHADRVRPITECGLKSGPPRLFGSIPYSQTVFVEGAELPLLSSKAILSCIQDQQA